MPRKLIIAVDANNVCVEYTVYTDAPADWVPTGKIVLSQPPAVAEPVGEVYTPHADPEQDGTFSDTQEPVS